MAQPLARPDAESGGIDAAAARLEQAFARLESAAARASAKHASLKETEEKLNSLLQEAEEKSARVKHITGTVVERIARTIDRLEHREGE